MTAVAHAPSEHLDRRGRLHVSDRFDEMMARLDSIEETVRANGAQHDIEGRLAPSTIEALKSARVFDIGVPVEVGGLEFSPRQVVAVIERITEMDAATGWVVMVLQMITGTTAAYLGDEATRELFSGSDYPLMAGQGTKFGQARKVEGGYRLSGQWHFASGSQLADMIHTAAVDEMGRPLIFTLPKSECTMVDNWDVMGLRATSSDDYTVEDVFVPDAYVYEVTTKTPLHGGAIYEVGLANMSGIQHGGWALGMGKRLLEEMRKLAKVKSQRAGDGTTTDQFYAEYAQAEAKLRGARAFLMQTWADNEETINRGEPLSTHQESLTRLSLNNATWTAHDVCMTVYKWAGTTALREGDLQRYFRDMHAGTQHMSSGPGVLQQCGRQLAGLAEGSRWVFFSLVESAPTQ
ncbi:acyl-CoA dehydrogenase [Rhodococcus oxybenzonivorans]|uniref:Acyl-CoA dehydrogenase n=1 Tax=Rhodococcus oxybenzonivorans TaxID=1990687 RepID=A0A2S2BNT8_9NOCA|nr:acyl-CoA dehydrogenase family protein [Rhodococcus oxybenzonivorans]AWK70301.1 acyl-CoA dehydrogenase [Rhodococcus oxybenzonivorans]